MTCPVTAQFLGIDLPACGELVEYVVRFECANGCEREPRELCGFHAKLLMEGDPAATCGVCREGRATPVAVRPVGGAR